MILLAKRQHGLWLCLILWLIASKTAIAQVFYANPSNYSALVSRLTAGDILQLQAGRYHRGLLIKNMHGKAGKPITIMGPEIGPAAILLSNKCCNTVQLNEASYIAVRNLTLDGQGFDGIDAVNSHGITHHITIENMLIIGHGGGQLTVGISTKGPAWNWIIRGNSIIRAGTGMYLGNSDGNQQFVNGIVESNFVLDSLGYNLQIKHQNARLIDIGFPEGIHKTIIRRNVFSKATNYSTQQNARPNVLLGHFPLKNQGRDDLYEVYGNVFYQNPVEALFQGEGNIALYNNVMKNDFGNAIVIQKHNNFPRSIRVFHNTIMASGVGVRVDNAVRGYQQSVIGNMVFDKARIIAPIIKFNLKDTYNKARIYLNKPEGHYGLLDFYPKEGTPESSAVKLAQFSGLSESSVDFNGYTRNGQYRGAYAGDGLDPGETPTKPGNQTETAMPILNIAVIPTRIESGQSASVIWTSLFVDDCNATTGNVWSGRKSLSNLLGERIGPFDKDTILSMHCDGLNGPIQQSVKVSVIPADIAPPKIISVYSDADGRGVVVEFNEVINKKQAENIQNYIINHAVPVQLAQLSDSLTSVKLTTSALEKNLEYTLTVSNITDNAKVPNVIAKHKPYRFMSLTAMKVTRFSPAGYQWDSLRIGTRLYTDRNYTFKKIPQHLLGSVYLRTANIDKKLKAATSIEFYLDEAVTAYIGYDQRIDQIPKWMKEGGWQKTSEWLESTNDAKLQLYRKPLAKGLSILGGNEFEHSMYVVVLKRKKP